MALRAVDLTKPVSEEDKIKLQADCKYLLDEFYLRYAYVSSREDLRTTLLRRGALLTLIFFVLSAGFAVFALWYSWKGISAPTIGESIAYSQILLTFSTLIFVVFAGLMGAFVSMSQRLQTISNHGDPIYNLSLLTHGWLSIFLSPISGAIFALILYLFFSGGLLSGTIFPTMVTAPPPEIIQNSMVVIAENSPTTGEPQNSAPSEKKIERASGMTDFFSPQTGPKAGKDFALLMIWAFIAGFAERFVPDTLMRLVNQKKPNEASAN